MRADLIERPRLDALFRDRFDRRVTLLTAGPGFGKSTLLARALADPFADDTCIDVWLELEPEDNDGDNLESALRDVLRNAAPVDPETANAPPWDLVWAMAPTHVAIVLDECHHLRPGSDGTRFLTDLLAHLPRNGHLVIAGRERPPVPLTRLQASGDLLAVTEADLAFDDDELAEFLLSRGRPDREADGELRWPALAELSVAAGDEAVTGYVWEEIVAKLEPERAVALALLAPLGVLDDELVHHVTERDIDAASLVAGLPLTTRTEDGAVRLHDLWGPVLADLVGPDDRRKALRAGGELLLRRGSLTRAADAFARAEDADGLVAVAVAAAKGPQTRTDVRSIRMILAKLPEDLAGGAPRLLLEGFVAFAEFEEQAVPFFEAAMLAARRTGDRELEVLAIWRLTQTFGLIEGLPTSVELYRRACELAAEGEALAGALAARHEAYVALSEGRVDDALARIDDFDGFGPSQARLISARLLLDLGRPDDVLGRNVSVDDVADPDRAVDANLFVGLAIWLRGDLRPEDAFAIADRLAEVTVGRDVGSQAVNALSLVVIIALAAGERDRAVELADEAQHLAAATAGRRSRAYADVASALVLLDRGDEDAAAAALARVHDLLPVERHPARQLMRALVPLYVLVPASRPGLDASRLGPTLTTAVVVARNVVAARNGAPIDLPATTWQAIDLVRSHVPRPMIVELALAGMAQGVPGAEAMLHAVPDHHAYSRAALDHPTPSIAGAAAAALAVGPVRPERVLELRILGSMELLVDGAPIDAKAWSRERVRRLAAYLVDTRSARRRDIAAAVWPDLDDKAAAQNLRVNLAHLNAVLQPDRPAAEPPWFVRAEGDTLRLHSDGLVVDAWVLDRLLDDARQADQRGAPAEALDSYRRAVGMYRGHYLDELADSPIGQFERIRLRSAAALAGARAAELLLARGEPEEAMRLADRSIEIEPLLERAHLARIRAVLATGDRAAARATAALLIERLTEVGLAPEPLTAKVLEGLGMGAG